MERKNLCNTALVTSEAVSSGNGGGEGFYEEGEEPPDCSETSTSVNEPSPLSSKEDVKTSKKKYRIVYSVGNFRKRFFPEASLSNWNDWRWQIRYRIRTPEVLEKILIIYNQERKALATFGGHFPFAITPYYASLINRENPSDPIRRCVVPVAEEFENYPEEAEDPLNEEQDSPVEGLVHRYPDRVLFLVTSFCSTYCRYCTRSRFVGRGHSSRKVLERAINYLERNTAVRDVLVSGGDPLTLGDEALEWLLKRLRQIKHLEIIRIGTKVPVVLPQRITTTLTKILKRFHPLWMSIHFTHPNEITEEVKKACERLADAGIPLGSQTVLLKEVNDSVSVMKTLFQRLLKIRVRPYYLYQCDPIRGSRHFRTSVSKGLEIIEGLRGHTTGYAVPHYVIDAPGGGGKIPLIPNYVEGNDRGTFILRNYEHRLFRYPQ